MSLRVGIVVETHPEDHSVDLVMADDGSRVVGAQVLSPNGSTRTGMVDMPKVPPKGDKWDVRNITGQDQKAIVAFVGRTPVVIGFLYPQISQMTWEDKERMVYRHQSDVYMTVDKDGNTEIYHPSGTYLRIGAGGNQMHENLTSKNVDKSWKVDRNKDKKVHVHMTVANDGGIVSTADLSPDGKINIWAKSDINIASETHITLVAPRIDFNPIGLSAADFSPGSTGEVME